MMQAYLDHGDTGTAVFEFFMRKLPARRGFLMAAGLEQALDFLENLRFSPADIDWLAQTGRFGKASKIVGLCWIMASTGIAVFEFFMRKLPARRGFLMAAGLEQALDFLENLRFSPEASSG